MNGPIRILQQAASDLQPLKLRWALVGGLAVSVRTEPRFTRDADLAIDVPDDRVAEGLVRDLLGKGYRTEEVLEQTMTNRLATVRLLSPQGEPGGMVIDLLFASSGIEPEVVKESDLMEIVPGLRVPVSRVGHLIALKVLARDDTRRPQDRVDLVQLIRAADAREIERAKAALDLIGQRGYSRGKDLRGELDMFLETRG